MMVVAMLLAGCAVQQPEYWGGVKKHPRTQTDSLDVKRPESPAYEAGTSAKEGLPSSDDTLVVANQKATPRSGTSRTAIPARIDDSDHVFAQLLRTLEMTPTSDWIAKRRPPHRDTIRIALASVTGRLTSAQPRSLWEFGDLGPGQPQDSDGDGVPDSLDLCDQTPHNAIVNASGCPLDGDGDGVYDGIDQCPGTPNFVRMVVDSVGCPADEDGDGVPDYLDYCPDTPHGMEVTKLGCLPDGDDDGIADVYDHCPDTPKGMQVDSSGCLVITQLHRQLALQISYIPGTNELDRLSRRILDDLAIRLKDAPSIVAVIEGFTDRFPNSQSALVASSNHVKTIIDYLAGRGIKGNRIKALNLSNANGRDGNRPAVAGLQDNYRIEISFYSDEE